MAYEISWRPKTIEELKELDLELAKRIILKINDLKLAPYHFVEKLTGSICWRLRVGDYRIIINIDEEKKEIQVLKIGHRKKIYK